MAYSRFRSAWKNRPDTSTPITAEALDHFENGVKAAHDALDGRLSDTTLNATYAPATPAALNLFRAVATAKRNTAPVVVVGAGDSHTAGYGASTAGHRWLNLFAAALQKVYPLDSGATSPPVVGLAAAVSTPPTAPGVQVVNAAVAGTTAANYLTDTTGGQVAALNPALVIHAVGSNDYDTGVPIDTYTANLEARIDQIDAAATGPVVHLLIHTHLRTDPVSSTAGWSEFRDAMRSVAGADSAHRAFIDVSGAFADAFADDGDPLDLVGTDLVHLTNAGHAFFAATVAAAAGLPAGSVPTPRTPVWNTFTSDTFTGDGTIVGRSTTAANGGTAKTWQVQTPGTAPYETAGGVLVRGATPASQFAGIDAGVADAALAVKVTAFPQGGPVYLEARRGAVSGGDAYLLELAAGSGFFALKKRVGGTVTSLGVTSGYAAGEVLELRVIGGEVSVFRNGTQTGNTIYDSAIGTGNVFGIATAGATTSFSLDDLAIKKAY